MCKKVLAHPYIPNSVPDVKKEMLREVEARDSEELYAQMIPERLRSPMDLPEPLTVEQDLKWHV